MTPYNYVQNNPILRIDPTGALDTDVDDWYEDEDGNIQYDASITSQADLNAAGISGTYLGEQGMGIDPNSGMAINYNSNGSISYSANELPEVTVTAIASNDKAIASYASDGAGGLGVGIQTQGGSLRLTNGAYNGNALSLKYYETGWAGGSRARITTYQFGTAGKFVGRAGTAGSIAVGAYVIGMNAYHEGGFGTYTQQATGRFAGTLGGAWLGAKGGAAVGVWFGGWGAIPGGIIGGLLGGFGGSKAGEETVKYIQDEP